LVPAGNPLDIHHVRLFGAGWMDIAGR
jgi:hypothetical protein